MDVVLAVDDLAAALGDIGDQAYLVVVAILRPRADTTDIPLAFDNLAALGSPIASGVNGQAMADAVSGAFAAFARYGDPNNAAIPPYTLPRRDTLVFDRATRLVDDPRGAERRLFAAVPYIQPGT